MIRPRHQLYPVLLVAAFLALFALPAPASLRESVLVALFILALVAFLLGMTFARPPAAGAASAHLAVVLAASVVLSAIFWFRFALDARTFEAGMTVKLAHAFLFWLPAVAFACLYRFPGERWWPAGRLRFAGRTAGAVVAGLFGLLVAIAAHDFIRTHHDREPLAKVMEQMQSRAADDGISLTYRHDDGVLYLDLAWPAMDDRSNHAELRRIRGFAHRYARLVERIDTDRLVLAMSRNGERFAGLEWSRGDAGRPWDLVRVDHAAAGIEPFPDQRDLGLMAEHIVAAERPRQLGVAMDGSTLHLTWNGDAAAVDSAEGIQAIAREWRAVNQLVRETRLVFRQVDAFRISMPGHDLDVSAADVPRHFRAQRHITVPAGSAVIQLSDDPDETPPAQRADVAPACFLWRDGEFTQRSNRACLWPWESGVLESAGYRVHLLDVTAAGEVRFLLAALHDARSDAGPIVLSPGQSVRLGGIHVRHLDWHQADPAAD